MKKIIPSILSGIFTIALLSLLTMCDDAMLESIQDEVTVLISSWSYFPLSDTGQDIDTDTATEIGEDADHVEMPSPSFTDNGDGTVTDNVTGLVWTKCALGASGQVDSTESCLGTHGTYSWQGALDACSNLDYAGSTSWHVPTITEFLSIFTFRARDRDESAVDPVFNENHFNSCSDPEFTDTMRIIIYCTTDMTSTLRYWTSDRWPKTTSGKTYIWTINTFDAHVNVNELTNEGADPKLYARCVRSK